MKNMDKVDGPDADKSEWIKLEFLMDPDNPAFRYSWKFAIFKDGCPEKWIKWVMAFFEIKNLMPMKKPVDKTRMFRILFKSQSLSYFEDHLMRRMEAEDSEVPEYEFIELVLRDIDLEYIPKRAISVKNYYMRQPSGLYMGLNTSLQQFIERLNDLNHYLLYFSEESSKQLDQDEIIEISHQSKAPECHEAMMNANIDIFVMSYVKSVSYFKRLENLEKIRRTNGPNPSSLPVDNKKRVYVTRSVGKSSKNRKSSNMWYGIVTRETSIRLIAEQLSNLNSRKRLALKPKVNLERSLWPSFFFLKKFMHSKGRWNLKRLQAVRRRSRKAESILSTEIHDVI
jgi:hypothetical protein